MRLGRNREFWWATRLELELGVLVTTTGELSGVPWGLDLRRADQTLVGEVRRSACLTQPHWAAAMVGRAAARRAAVGCWAVGWAVG